MIAVIPARGKSKRIPRKNIRLLADIPIIGIVLNRLKDTRLFERIIVSTDDKEIASIASKYDAEVVIRPDCLSDDFISYRFAISHCLQELDIPLDTLVIVTFPTSLSIVDLNFEDVLAQFEQFNPKFLVGVKQYEHPVSRSFKKNEFGFLTQLPSAEILMERTQDSCPSFYDCGQIYLATSESWRSNLPVLSEDSLAFEISSPLCVDIDNPKDLDLIKAIWASYS